MTHTHQPMVLTPLPLNKVTNKRETNEIKQEKQNVCLCRWTVFHLCNVSRYCDKIMHCFYAVRNAFAVRGRMESYEEVKLRLPFVPSTYYIESLLFFWP